MKSLLMFALLIPSFTQASIICDIRDVATKVVPKTMSDVLECSNQKQIEKDFNSTLDRFNICKQDEKIVNPEVICTVVSKFVVDKFVSTIPEPWECSAEKFTTRSQLFLTKNCIKILKR